MGIFNKKQPREIIFLMPVHLEGEKLPKSKIRMLYCDTAGNIYTTMMNRSVYHRVRDIADGMERTKKPFAVIGQETSRGDYISTAVEINSEEEQALEYILEHALKSGKLPDILKKYIKPIIKRAQTNPVTISSGTRLKQ
jgi:hypothetical protein